MVLDLPRISVLVEQDVVLSIVDDRSGLGFGHAAFLQERLITITVDTSRKLNGHSR
jgi:hypothetical protein